MQVILNGKFKECIWIEEWWLNVELIQISHLVKCISKLYKVNLTVEDTMTKMELQSVIGMIWLNNFTLCMWDGKVNIRGIKKVG